FVEYLDWMLTTIDGMEVDEFDQPTSRYCVLRERGRTIGGFRMIDGSLPTLTAKICPSINETYLQTHDLSLMEITRFGADRRIAQARTASQIIYALMLHYGYLTEANGLVAIVDLLHERLLKRMGLVIERFGDAFTLPSASGAKLDVVAGQIPLTRQKHDVMEAFNAALNLVEIYDDTNVLGSKRLSA
ncbi:MAG: acyl-homoserine-lactone synthase, partial [Pseudomonadota bacterium]